MQQCSNYLQQDYNSKSNTLRVLSIKENIIVSKACVNHRVRIYPIGDIVI